MLDRHQRRDPAGRADRPERGGGGRFRRTG
ncbi:hypothetical protein QIS99_17960 [Streptomyces sp. B-S-A8]|uniref:Uncharacterized protein n=1 Tax=Streptomyces solicavernae TaxID=3043614 RepID=A0ABT6RUI6_9ACTN|nr:hypothetical protein [Streptomyces sp. B-S-A8]MDI3388072.1 hypothetical protein [Streptomyces sp. B-S-A8]